MTAALPLCLALLTAAPPAHDSGPWLVFDIAKSIYAPDNQGGNFVIAIKHGATREIVYRAVWGAESGVWLPQAVNLRRFAGQALKIRLQTIASYAFSNACFLFWGRPRVVTGPLDGSTAPALVADLTERFRLGQDCRRYIFDAEKSGPLKTDQYDFTGGYFEYGQAGPWAEPALFGHPFCYGFHSWAGFEFDVILPDAPPEPPPPPPTLPVASYPSDFTIFTWDQEVYRGAPGGMARFDPATLRLETRMNRTGQGLGYAFAGFEACGADTLWLRAEFDTYHPWAAYGEMENNRFVGIVLDYHTPRGYARRVFLHHPPMRPEHPDRRCERRAPAWQMDLARPSRTLEVNWEQVHDDLPLGNLIGLDLRKWAPPDWDGRFWFGIGVQDAGDEATFAATILYPRPIASPR
jgi:hypothetical protein